MGDLKALREREKQFKLLFKFVWIINQRELRREFRRVFARAALVLSEYDVGNDLGFGISVEAGGEFATLHVELLTQHGGGELYVKRLVADGEVLGVACDDGTHHVLPPLDETVLVERGFETLLTEILAYEVAYGFGIGASHAFRVAS